MSETSKYTRSDVIKALAVTAEIFDKAFSKAAAELMMEDLSAYNPGEVITALSSCRRELRHFPTVADVVSRIPGKAIDHRGQALEIAGRIMKSVTFLGPYKAKEAREEIGEIGWAVVSMSGGWASICEMSDKDIGIRMPQWSQMAESMLRRGVTNQRRVEIRIDDQVRAQIKLPEFPGGKK